MKTEVHEVDLAKAKDWIEKNLPYTRGVDGTNRPISKRKVNQYAIDMLRGNWKLTHQGIAFAVAGLLKDGQHRLLALIQAAEEGAIDGDEILKPKPRIKIPMQVTFGLDDTTFEVLDTGLPRSANQVLAIAGYNNTTYVAAAARLLYMFEGYEFRHWKTTRATNHDVLKVVRDTRIDEYITPITPLKPIGFIIPATAVGYYVCEKAMPTGPHEEWLYGLKNGESMRADDPCLVFRNYIIRSKGQPKVRRDAYMHLALYIIAWNDYVAKKRRSVISWRSTASEFPKPYTIEK